MTTTRPLVAALLVLGAAACRDQAAEPGASPAPTASPASTSGSDAPLVPANDPSADPAAAPASAAGAGEPNPPASGPASTSAASFQHDAPGKLLAGSGSGAADPTIWAPNMRFPIEASPAYANSQVWGAGGMNGPGGGQCDARNYSYPWRDNFCESRGYANQFCGDGKGHQGQDIRPSTCKKAKHWAVAAEDGVITGIGSYTVFLTARSGRLYRYLHMDMAKARQMLRVGQEVKRGERLGLVSNDFGSTATTIHLHFEIKAPVTRNGQTVFTFVPPYPSLVNSYQRLLAAGG